MLSKDLDQSIPHICHRCHSHVENLRFLNMTDVDKHKISPHLSCSRCEKFQIFPHLSFIVVLWFRLFVISALLSKICAVLRGEKLYQSYGHKITNMRYNPEDATHCMIHTDCIWGPFLPGVFSNVSSIPLFETLIERKQTHTGFPNWGLNSSVTQSFWKGEDEKPQPVLWARVDGRPMRSSIYIWGSWHVLSPRIGSPVFLPLQNLTFGIRHHLRGSFMGMKGIQLSSEGPFIICIHSTQNVKIKGMLSTFRGKKNK